MSARDIMREFDVDEGTAVALLATVEADALLTRDGRLLPESRLRRELVQRLRNGVVVALDALAEEFGVDVSEMYRIAEAVSASVPILRLRDNSIASVGALLAMVRRDLQRVGVCDLLALSRRIGADYDSLETILRKHLSEHELLVSPGECVVTKEWVEHLRKTAEEQGRVRVTETAKEFGVRRRAMLHILRRHLRGAYVRSADMFLVVPS